MSSNLFKKYISLKIQDNKSFYLFENGIFYIFLHDDARIMSEVLNIKLTNLTPTIYKCGFPKAQLEKYLNKLSCLNYNNIKIVKSNSFLLYSKEDYCTNKHIKDFIDNIANISPETLSISQAYDLIGDIVIKARHLSKEFNPENNVSEYK